MRNRMRSIIIIDLITVGQKEDHMRLCYKILKEQIPNANIKCIGIRCGKEKKGDIYALKKALEKCLCFPPEIISLSLGSTILADYMIIENSIRKLKAMGTIVVAAISNQNVLTVPASFPGIIGVISDVKLPIRNPDIFYLKGHPLGANFYLKDSDTEQEMGSGNSFGVPFVVAQLYKINGKNNMRFSHRFIPYHFQIEKKRADCHNEVSNRNKQITVVDSGEPLALEEWKRLIIALRRYGKELAFVKRSPVPWLSAFEGCYNRKQVDVKWCFEDRKNCKEEICFCAKGRKVIINLPTGKVKVFSRKSYRWIKLIASI